MTGPASRTLAYRFGRISHLRKSSQHQTDAGSNDADRLQSAAVSARRSTPSTPRENELENVRASSLRTALCAELGETACAPAASIQHPIPEVQGSQPHSHTPWCWSPCTSGPRRLGVRIRSESRRHRGPPPRQKRRCPCPPERITPRTLMAGGRVSGIGPGRARGTRSLAGGGTFLGLIGSNEVDSGGFKLLYWLAEVWAVARCGRVG